ncbi:VPDSG-CTERM sorting domain-containing protein [Arenimonas sp.]|nr:VPDSG-CTERM sorting domain-containing protein [Candidatus Parcubacteria bacterium]
MSFSAYLTSDTLHVNPLARTEARLVVGKGASRVPDSGTTGALFSATLFGLLGISRKFRK